MNVDVINKLKSDPIFALNFALDNNFEGLRSNAVQLGLASTTNTPAELKQIILNLAYSGQKQALQQIFTAKYLNDKTNGTGGYADFFVNNSPKPTPEQKSMDIWTGFLAFVGGGLAALSTASTGGAGTMTQAQIDAEKAKAEEERKARIRGYWTIGLTIAGIALISWLVYKAWKKK